MSMKRLEYPITQEWHVVINKYHDTAMNGDFKRWMYEAKKMADEVPRMTALFGRERRNELATAFKKCSMSPPVAVPSNYLFCCLGVRCSECPQLLALDDMQRVTPEDIDSAKAWTCAAHIISDGGDRMNEGYLLTKEDRMFWDSVYDNLREET